MQDEQEDGSAMTSKGLKLLAYGRVSDVRGREGPSFISPEDQMERIRGYATAYSHTILEEGLEWDISGGVMQRPVFDRFLQAVRDGQAHGIIVAKLDRFARSSSGALAAIEEIEKTDGVLISVSEQIDSSTAGKFLRTILFAAAQWERERIGEAWKSARSHAVERGIHVSRHVPPGYERLPKSGDADSDRRLVPHPEHAQTMMTAYTMAARGDSYSRIATYLNNRSLPVGGKDGTWTAGRIKRLLANRVYLGEARSGEGNVKSDAHKPLVQELTWNMAQRRSMAPPLTEKSETLLGGLCRCASCSFAMKSQQARGSSVAIYRCPTQSLHGRCPAPSTVSLERLEGHVIEQFLAHAGEATGTPTEDGDTEAMAEAIEAERSYRSALLDTELRRQIGDTDHAQMVAGLHRAWQDALPRVKPGRQAPGGSDGTGSAKLSDLVAELQRRGDTQGLRDLMAAEIQAVFVRPAESRSKKLPISDRVRIVWQDEEPLELPRRGQRFEPRAFAW